MGVIHLVRHGQASFGTDNYDKLSPLGHRQAGHLGLFWEATGFDPSDAVAGTMVRHAETAITAIDTCGVGDGYDTDGGWNEYDHLALANAEDPTALAADNKVFQQVLNRAIERWIDGGAGFSESFEQFRSRVLDAFESAVSSAGPGKNIVVFTSGGPIALVVSHVLAGDHSLFQRLNDVVVNASVTTIINGRSGQRLLSFNEHAHLPADDVTYR